MSREQIEEMAKDLYGYSIDTEEDCDFVAKLLYTKGYRKQSENTVEVVRCKDCISCEYCYPAKAKGKEAIEAWYCHFHKRYASPDAFCSFAKMKGGAE